MTETLGIAAVVGGIIAAAYFAEGCEERKQARALEADDRMRARWGIPAELMARRTPTPQPQPKPKRKRSA
jgi:hypothetical protein